MNSMLIGLPVSLAGLGLRAWAGGHLAKDRQLATSGPYSYVRNPLYLGTLIAALGIVIASRSVVLAVVFCVAFLAVYLPAVELEEQHLREIFPDYDEYAARVNRFLPIRYWDRNRHRFSWALYRKNEEYKALIGFLIAVVWLIWRCWSSSTVT
jgi:protein-S-isoprenylcysteine O-methyltransferase Ste14